MPIVIASSFADPQDIANYLRALKAGYTPTEALKFGDDGVGCWGDTTSDTEKKLCALPPEEWEAKWGRGKTARGRNVAVTHRGKRVIGQLGDTMPHKRYITNGAGIDLNPAFARAFGLIPPFLEKDVLWEWCDV